MNKNNYLRPCFVYVLLALFYVSSAGISFAYEKEVNSFSASIAEKIAGNGKKTVTVINFTDLQGNMTEIGRFFAEEFSVALADAGKGLEVLDRNSLKFIMAENKAFSTGIIEPRSIKKINQDAGVEALITGTITPFSDTIRISIRIIDTKTGIMFGSLRGNIARTKAVEELLAKDRLSGHALGQALPVQAKDGMTDSPLQPETSSQSLTPSIDAKESAGIRDRLISILSYKSSTGNKAPYTDDSRSKRIGELTVIMKNITLVPGGGVDVMLGLYNSSNTRVMGLSHKVLPNLTDEKGNVFEYIGGIKTLYHGGRGWRDCVTLYYEEEKEVVLHFSAVNKDIKIKEIGAVFALSLDYLLYNPKNRRTADYQASFVDIGS